MLVFFKLWNPLGTGTKQPLEDDYQSESDSFGLFMLNVKEMSKAIESFLLKYFLSRLQLKIQAADI